MIEESHRAMTRSILTTFRRASPDQLEYGLGWYDAAGARADHIGWLTGHTVTQSVVALAHLSPRTHWQKNLELLDRLLRGMDVPQWALKRQWAIAKASLEAEDPLATFSPRARKTYYFARALLGDQRAICIDTWAARAAGVDEDFVRSQQGYNMVAGAYKRGSRRVGLPPRELQSVVWCVARGGHR